MIIRLENQLSGSIVLSFHQMIPGKTASMNPDLSGPMESGRPGGSAAEEGSNVHQYVGIYS